MFFLVADTSPDTKSIVFVLGQVAESLQQKKTQSSENTTILDMYPETSPKSRHGDIRVNSLQGVHIVYVFSVHVSEIYIVHLPPESQPCKHYNIQGTRIRSTPLHLHHCVMKLSGTSQV